MSTWPEPYPTRTPFPPPSNGCGCWRCWDDERPPTTGSRWRDLTLHPVVMHVCGDCGSKRCARAGNHRTKCQEGK